MRNNRLLHIRLLILTALMLVCGGWNGVVWGQNSITNLGDASNATTIKSTRFVDSFNNNMVEFTLNRDSISKYAGREEEWLKKLYTRWYIEDETAGGVIPISNWNFANKDSRNNAYKYTQGFVYFAKHAGDISGTVENFIINSDFEDGNIGSGEINSWNNGWGNNSTREVSASGYGYNSNYSLKLYNPNDSGNNWDAQTVYNFQGSLTVGNTYILSAWVKSDVVNSEFQVQVQNPATYDGEAYTTITTVANEWVYLENEFTCTKENITRACINFGKKGGTYYVDNIKLSEKIDSNTYKAYNAVTAQITPPYDTNWQNKKVVCLVATDTTGIVRGSSAGSITTEPSFNMRFETTFATKDDIPLIHKYRPGNTATEIIYTTDQVEVYNGIRYQKTSKWTYDVYVKPGETVNLILPLQDLMLPDGSVSTTGGETEPHAYFRWYDYKTDKIHPKTSRYDNREILKEYGFGYMAYNYEEGTLYNKPVLSSVGVIKFSAPNNSDFHEVVACDVSDYRDYTIESNSFTEPTINIRYIFNIRSDKYQADIAREKFINQTYLENNGYVTLNVRNNETEFTLRTEQRLPSDYHFYTLNSGVTDVSNLNISNFSETISKGNFIAWFVRYNGVIIKGPQIDYSKKSSRFFTFKRNDLNSILDNTDFEVFAYATTEYVSNLAEARQKGTPINYNVCKFVPDRGTMTIANLEDDKYKYRTYEFLSSRYQLAAEINFDNLDEEGEFFNYDTPTLGNNLRKYPHNVENSTYGFVYPTLGDYKTPRENYTWAHKNSPVHGEYGYYKSANLEGVSKEANEYSWWYGGSPTFYDRTYHTSNGAKYGYFMYTDASDESRALASVDFEANLCAGSALVFTAWIADLTSSGQLKPQVMFKIYGIDENNNATLLQSMLSEIIPGVAEWRQFYADIILQQKDANVDYKSYRVAIDNYCKGTVGADYAIDDIRMFIKNSQVELVQEKAYCEGDSTELKVEIDYDAISTKLGLKSNENISLRYHMIEENGNRVALGKDVNDQPIYELLDNLVGDYNNDKSARPAKYETRNNVNYFILQDTLKLELDPNKTYYLLVDHKAVGAEDWTVSEVDDACSIVSNPFKVGRASINIVELDESNDNSVSIKCDETEVTLPTFTAQLTFPDGEGGLYYINDVKFDWYLKGVMPTTLINALKNLRKEYPAANSPGDNVIGNWSSITAKGIFTAEHISTLNTYKADMVFNAPSLTDIILLPDSNIFSAVPVLNTIPLDDGKELTLCDELIVLPIMVKSIGGPVLDLGFSDVDYKAMGDGANVVRLGLKQFETMQDGATLVVPIKNFANERKRGSTKLADLIPISGNEFLNLIETNDPTYKNADFGAFAIAKINNLNTIATGSAYSVTFTFVDGSLKSGFKMHEGYYYTVKFNFMNSVTEGMEGVDPCAGSTTFTFKVVPEYLTFSNEGVNWSNDDNWVRSTQVTLYKSDGQNTDLYKDYTGELEHKGYAPMRFTKVTVTKAATPHLYELPNDATTGTLDMTTNNKLEQAPTQYIEYDMMVKSSGENSYDCEKFYSNTCDQIYFKPEAEMLNQHLLTYNTAWVDFELTANRWYMLGSPLQGVVAGDMYLPLPNRRQETEAFQPITFDSTLVNHNRALLPVYQRSWDQSKSMVLKPDGSSYDAYKGRVANWSHVYNDVEVDYSKQGFSIKADKKDGSNEKVMFRIPKADEKYRYFSYSDASTKPTSTANEKTIARNNAGKLRTDGTTNGAVTVALATNAESDLFLMCNPYMAALDMTAFFNANTHLEKKYWTIVEGKQSISNEITSLGEMKPLQAFLVKPTATSNVSFTPEMTKLSSAETQEETTRSGGLEMSCLKIIANADNAESTALLLQADWADNDFTESEDVEALFDSNLKDQPTVYTIAGQQAASINAVTNIETIALGIYQNSDEPITVTFDGMDSFAHPLYIYDAETGECNELTRSTTITTSATTAGRFYILNKAIADSQQESLLEVSVVNKTIELSMANGELIEEVMMYDTNGYLLRHEVGINSPTFETTIYNDGVIVVRTQTTVGVFIKKILMK